MALGADRGSWALGGGREPQGSGDRQAWGCPQGLGDFAKGSLKASLQQSPSPQVFKEKSVGKIKTITH